jgi:glycosyltransferase involved in cell wall biosynthesis
MDEPLDDKLVSVIVPCKGRLHHLRRTLPAMLAQDCSFPFEIIVVDFGCPQGTFDWCKSLDVWKLIALKVLDDTGTFHLSRARNCGASLARGKVLAFVDADVFLDEKWLRLASRPLFARRAGLGTIAGGLGVNWGRYGTCIVSAEVFHAVRGYDEGLRGWGPEDADFCSRCVKQTAFAPFNPFLLTPIEHGDEERARYQPDRNIGLSNTRNWAYLGQRQGIVNPHGYGQGEFMIARGSGTKLPPLAWARRRRIRRPLRLSRNRVPCNSLPSNPTASRE